MKTLRQWVTDMLEMRRIAAWREARGEHVMAGWADAAARFHERHARALLRSFYCEGE